MNSHTSYITVDDESIVVGCNDCSWKHPFHIGWRESVSVEHLTAVWHQHLLEKR